MTGVAETIADVTIPDTALVRDVTAFIRDTEDDLLYHHSRRVFLFGSVRARARGLRPDPELLYTAAMFHDIGLTQNYRDSQLRFEVDGANAARDFLRARGVDDRRQNARHRHGWSGWGSRCTPRPVCRSSWNPRSRR